MKTIFIDTSYLLALEMKSDKNHKAVNTHWKTYRKTCPLLTTTSYVFDELVTFLNNSGRHDKAVEIGEMLLSSHTFHFVHVDDDLFKLGWDRFKNRPDKSFSLTDCISFITMEVLNIQAALTFDEHFLQAGFQVIPGIKLRS